MSQKLGLYLPDRVSKKMMGKILVRQYSTLVGMTDHVTDAILEQATSRLKTDMDDTLSRFRDPIPVIDCVLACHFMEQQSPRVLSDKDRKEIDSMFETLKRLYEEDLKTGAYKQAFRSDYTDQQFEEDFGDLPEGIRHGILVEDRAESAVSRAIGFGRYTAWQIKPDKKAGRQTGLERIRTWYKQNPRIEEKKSLTMLQPTEGDLVSSFECDILMAQALACELASISRFQTKTELSRYTESDEADRRAKIGQPQDDLCKPLFKWVFGTSPDDYQGFRERAEKKDWLYISQHPQP